MRGWLCLEKDPDSYVAARSGYSDLLGHQYSWDDRVPNAKSLEPGHYIALWDSTSLLGISVIESIEVGSAVKQIGRCPSCTSTDTRRRKSDSTYKCGKCREVFVTPTTELVEVRTFTADYSAAWIPINGVGADACRALTLSFRSQHSMRPLDMARFEEFRKSLQAKKQEILLRRATPISGGHREAVVRTRIGQSAFRERLLSTFGATCIFSGATPPIALHAAHLYRYSDLGKHEIDGGLLMRADLHLLFDDGTLLVEPESKRIHVAPELRRFAAYSQLHGKALTCELQTGQWNWIRLHWLQHGTDHAVS
jgi:hypothetical protein